VAPQLSFAIRSDGCWLVFVGVEEDEVVWDILVPYTGQDLYRKAAAHLYGVARGNRHPLAEVARRKQRKAWRQLAEVEPQQVQEFEEALVAGLAGC
jgi:hypothetical protein